MERRSILRGVLFALFIVVTPGVGRAFDEVPAVGEVPGTTGCFTDTIGHPFETFICWMSDNSVSAGIGGGQYGPGLPVTRGEMAVFMQRSANVPPATGLITISAGNANWRPFTSEDPLAFTYFSSVLQASRTSAGGSFLSVHPDVPTVLYGRSVQFVGVEFCYGASANVTLSYVEINFTTSSAGAGGRTLAFSDSTARTDSACRYYVLPSPIGLTVENGVNFFVQGSWAVAGSPLSIGRTTFVLQPTETVAAAPSRPGVETVVLRPRDAGDPSTESAPRQ
jgi:hypothetical protein